MVASYGPLDERTSPVMVVSGIVILPNPKSLPKNKMESSDSGKDTVVPSRPVRGISLSVSQMLCRRSRPCS